MRRFRWRGIALILSLGLIAAACGSGSDGDTPEGKEGGAVAGPTVVDVVLKDFTIEPAALHATAGAPITFNVTNEGQAPHTFGVDVNGQMFETPELAAGAAGTLEVPALEAGEYQTICTVPGHSDLGMVGTLTVDAEGQTDTASGAGGDAGGGDAGTDHSNLTAEQMAEMHEKGVLDFVGQLEKGPLTDTMGNQPLEPVMDGKVKVFELVVEEIQWEIAPGEIVDAMAFNGQVPGPEIRVEKGDQVRFEIQNQMTQPFTLHFHGITLPNDQDGVPYVTQPPIMPGEYWTYEYTIVDPPGMYVYHSHFNSTEQVGKGLYGALIVDPGDAGWKSVYGVEPAVEFTMFTGDGPLGYGLNAKSFPATEPIVAQTDDWVLVHMANDGGLLHPMHLHGFHFLVVGVDGFPLDPEDRYLSDTLVVAPGSRYDILVEANAPGAWAFHCHILPHVETAEGMFGMVTALVVV